MWRPSHDLCSKDTVEDEGASEEDVADDERGERRTENRGKSERDKKSDRAAEYGAGMNSRYLSPCNCNEQLDESP